MKARALALLSLAAIGVAAQAQFILSPTAVVSNTAGEFAPGDLQNAINQNGLDTPFVSGVTDFDAYIATNPIHAFGYSNNEWFSLEGVNQGTIVFDLGEEYIVSGFALWNEDAAGLELVNYSTSVDGIDFLSAGSQNPTNHPVGFDYGADVHLTSSRVARYVMLEMTGPQSGHTFNALSMGEFAVRADAVPEPATMALLGLGAAVLAAKRRKKA